MQEAQNHLDLERQTDKNGYAYDYVKGDPHTYKGVFAQK